MACFCQGKFLENLWEDKKKNCKKTYSAENLFDNNFLILNKCNNY